MTILVAGHINIETTLKIDGFPIDYHPVRYPFNEIRTTVAGVGLNIAKALTTLGGEMRLVSMIGSDANAILVRQTLNDLNIDDTYVRSEVDETGQSIILYDTDSKRAIYTDLKTIQDTSYPVEIAKQALDGCSLAVICNINYTRPMLKIAKEKGIPIATDVHTISDLNDHYNRDYMQAADILFMSDESLPMSPEDWAKAVQNEFGIEIIVIGLGNEGALLAVKSENYIGRIPALELRPIVNTVGAGDSLFSAFNYVYAQTKNPHEAIRKATIFASYRIGERGAAEGFLTADRLQNFYDSIY